MKKTVTVMALQGDMRVQNLHYAIVARHEARLQELTRLARERNAQ